MGVNDFQANNGWLDRFKKTNDIVYSQKNGEAAFVDKDCVNTWIKRLPTIIEAYAPKDIFNADETGLLFRCLPDKTITFKGDTCNDGNKSKDRLTILFCCNSDGSEKLEPLVISQKIHVVSKIFRKLT
jgi:hypothetical protein